MEEQEESNNMGLYLLNSKLSKILLPNNIVLCIYLLTGVIGNLYVIYIYSFRMKSKKDDRYFIPCLATVDLFACVFGSTFALSLNILPLRFHGDIPCKSMWFLCHVTTTCSCLLLLVIALHRYKKVVTPFEHQMTKVWKRVCIVVCGISSLFVSAPTLIYYGNIEFKYRNVTGHRCGALQQFPDIAHALMINNMITVVVLGLGVLSLAIMYGLIGRTIYIQYIRHRRPKEKQEKQKRKHEHVSTTSASTASSPESSSPIDNVPRASFLLLPDMDPVVHRMRQFRRSSFDAIRNSMGNVWNHFRVHKYSYMFITITVVFVISYLPRVVLMILESVRVDFWDTLNEYETRVCLFLYRMYLINHVTNPIVYGYFDTKFKKMTKELLCSCFKRK